MESNRAQDPTKLAEADQPIGMVVETPRGCRNKYKQDPQTGRLKLSKVMPEGMVFPYDFGFIPDTEAEDGDPLDVLVLTDEPTFPGCQVDCYVIGVLKAEQEKDGKRFRNDRLIAVAQQSILYEGVRELSKLNSVLLTQIEAFFINYQKVRGIEFSILAREDAQRAREIVIRARRKRRAPESAATLSPDP